MRVHEYKPPLLNRYPALAELGWIPPIYIFGLVRNWGKDWCTWDGGFLPISSPHPVLWWPTMLHRRKRQEGVPIWWQDRYSSDIRS